MRDEQKLVYAGRPSSASPAVGYMAMHNEQQKQLVEQAFGVTSSTVAARLTRAALR